jgi:uncharacterized damage-inducible protein DinB
MLDFLHDLYGHQAWADAEHWRAFTAHVPALSDPALRKRLHHIHLVQNAFLFLVSSEVTPATVRGEDPRPAMTAGFPEPPDLHAYARSYHGAAAAFMAETTDEQLASRVKIPWFPGGEFTLSAGEALTQAAMHSHYHRGQNATRLRELGGEPPLTDLIMWYYKGRPAAEWGTR